MECVALLLYLLQQTSSCVLGAVWHSSLRSAPGTLLGPFFARLDPRGEKTQSKCWKSAVLKGCMHTCTEMLDAAAVKKLLSGGI